MKSGWIILALAGALLALAAPASARLAYIDWDNGVVIARGEAAAEGALAGNPEGARTAAMDSARKNMSYVIEQVILDASEDIAGHLSAHPEKRPMLDQLVQSAKLMNEESGGENVVKVTLSLPINGKGGLKEFMDKLKTAKPEPVIEKKTLEGGGENPISDDLREELSSTARGRSLEDVGKPYRIALPNFVDATFFTGLDLGAEVRNRFSAMFDKDRRFQLLGAAESEAILGEAGMTAQSALDAGLDAKIPVKDVDGVMVARILRYEPQEKKLGLGGAGYLSLGFILDVEVRIFDVANNRWVFDSTLKEEIKEQKSTLNSADDPEKFFSMKELDSDRGLAAHAVRKMITQLTGVLKSAFPLEGYVIKVMGDKVYINLTSVDGIREGDQLTVRRVGDMLYDPVTNEEIGRIRDRIGSLVVRESKESYSLGLAQELVEGPVQVGDIVEMK